MQGKRIGVWGGEFDYPIRALDHQHALGLQLARQAFDMSELIEGKVEAASCMSFNEMFIFDDKGISREDLSLFRFQDLGLNRKSGRIPRRLLWGDSIFLRTASTLATGCAKGIRKHALISRGRPLQGWEYAARHMDEAVEIVMRRARKSPFPTTRKHQQRMLAEIIRMVELGTPRQGRLDEEVFNHVVDALTSIGQIDQRPVYGHFYAALGPKTADTPSSRDKLPHRCPEGLPAALQQAPGAKKGPCLYGKDLFIK